MGSDKVKIDVLASANVIRSEILKYTPIGSGAEDVADIILSRFYYEGGFTSGIGIMPRPGVSVVLGDRPATRRSHTSVQAEWTFDEKLKLQDVQIEEMPQEGSFDARKASDNSPRIRITLLQSDDAIRQQLLKYTPAGSRLAAILAFLGKLHYLGGPASGVALTGKPGIGVVLAHQIDKDSGRDRAVKINWALDDHDNLSEIQIRRVDWPINGAN